MNSVDIHVTSASWNGDEGATHFSFSDGSTGVQHFIGTGLGMRVGELHTLTPEQHIAVVHWIDRQNVGKGIL